METSRKNSPRSAKRIIAAALLALWAHVGMAQETGAAAYVAIESDGVATVEVVADYVEFAFSQDVTGASFAEAMARAERFEVELRVALKTQELGETDIVAVGPEVKAVEAPVVSLVLRVQFSATGYLAPKDGPKAFANLCDGLRKVAAGLGCRVTGPRFGVRKSVEAEQKAIGKALENAYSSAEGAARTMQVNIVAVERVVIEEVQWGTEQKRTRATLTMGLVACTARVHVTYTAITRTS